MTATDANRADSLGPIGEWEELGRSVLSRSHRRRAAGGVIPYRVFLERAGERNISVDRLSVAPPAESIANAHWIASQRDPPRNFYGWAVVDVEHARNAGCDVAASPLPNNPYHADIVLPDSAVGNRDAQKQYAVTLAAMAKWRPRPPEPDDETN